MPTFSSRVDESILRSVCAFSNRQCASATRRFVLAHIAPAVMSLLVFGAPIATAQGLGSAPAAKHSISLEGLERLRSGETAQFLVELHADDSEVRRKISNRHCTQRAGEEQRCDRDLKTVFDAMKEEVFPGGRMGQVRVLESYRSVPALFVEVPSIEDLEALLVHPAIKAVHENVKVYPALQ